MKATKLYIGYSYESALGKTVNKCVICNSVDEYRRMKEKIDGAGFALIEFIQVYEAKKVLGD